MKEAIRKPCIMCAAMIALCFLVTSISAKNSASANRCGAFIFVIYLMNAEGDLNLYLKQILNSA